MVALKHTEKSKGRRGQSSVLQERRRAVEGSPFDEGAQIWVHVSYLILPFLYINTSKGITTNLANLLIKYLFISCLPSLQGSPQRIAYSISG